MNIIALTVFLAGHISLVYVQVQRIYAIVVILVIIVLVMIVYIYGKIFCNDIDIIENIDYFYFNF